MAKAKLTENEKFLLKYDLDDTFDEIESRLSTLATLLIDKEVFTLKESTKRLKRVRKWFKKTKPYAKKKD